MVNKWLEVLLEWFIISETSHVRIDFQSITFHRNKKTVWNNIELF